MEKKIEELPMLELDDHELWITNGGSEREDEKQANLWEAILKYLRP